MSYRLLSPVMRLAGIISLMAIIHFLHAQHALAQTPRARAFQISERIRIDGKLDEPAWESAAPIGDLIQVVPREGGTPSEKTDVRILVDGEALYFGVVCHDRTSSAIIATQLTRDAELDVDDNISIVIDPFLDHRNGFFFDVNPTGARADGQISNSSEFTDLTWDGIWNAHARITPDGWVAEIVIPFKTLRFQPGQSVWGLNFERAIKRHNETNRWSGARQNIWLTNLAEAGRLEGLPDIHQGMGIDIRPYGLVVRKEGNDWEVDGGLDISKNLAPNLNASLTVNTDFAETEVDARQVNLTRFDLFYPEKRAFFLEGAGVFEMATGNTFFPDLIPFFSRRIGLMEQDGISREVPILAGGKITGRQSRFNIGVMDVQTGEVGEIGLKGQNLFVTRISRDFWKQSYVGGIFTNGNPSGTGGNTLIGADARFATSNFRGNKNLILSLFLFGTDDESSDATDYAGGFAIDYPNDRWYLGIGWKQIGESFRPALGFVPRTGMRKTNGTLMFRPRPENGIVRQFTFHAFPEVVTDLNNQVESWNVAISPFEVEFNSGDLFEIEVLPQFERLSHPFPISREVTLPPGSYQFTRYGVRLETATKRFWVVDFESEFGDFYNGTQRSFELGLTLKPNSHLLLGLEAERADVDLVQGRFFKQLFSVQADYNFSPNISWANLVQYDNESRILGFQTRFRWILQPGNDLFVVLNRGWEKDSEHNYVSSYDRGTVKLQYTFRF
ncbi:MAG: carbohydrate binding family 9 domain-containing protein [Acidobacteria bacterium]|nr:carbohydrate binding family 9 domain-containing protein [Acidobacteriota bacterium]